MSANSGPAQRSMDARFGTASFRPSTHRGLQCLRHSQHFNPDEANMARTLLIGIALIISSGRLVAEERTERFDKDPGWEGKNNRATTPDKRTVRQDFGYSRTANAGGKAGEIGGYISPAAETAYYAKKLDA